MRILTGEILLLISLRSSSLAYKYQKKPERKLNLRPKWPWTNRTKFVLSQLIFFLLYTYEKRASGGVKVDLWRARNDETLSLFTKS